MRSEMNADGKATLLSAVINVSLDCVIVIDEDGSVVEWNPAAEKAFGYSREEARGREIGDLIIPARYKHAHDVGFRRYLQGGSPRVIGRRVELAAIDREGEEFPVELTINEVASGSGRMFTASLRDLSERQRVERELLESRADFAAFLDHAQVAVFIKALDGRYEYANRSARELFGLSDEDIVGAFPRDVLVGEIGAEVTAMDEIVATGAEHVVEQRFRTVAGKEFDSLTARFPLFDHSGQPNRIGVVMVDISELRQAERDLEESRRRMLQAEKISALGSLLAGVSHELNNPLSVVLGETYLLIEDAENTAFAERAERIRQAAERCGRIVQTFLAMARRKQPELVPEDVNGIVNEAIALTEYARSSTGIAMEANLAHDLPAVLADRNLLHQVIVNLIVNAQQAMAGRDDSVVRVSTTLEAGQVVVRVADNGPGVPPAVAERIFEPFYTTKSEGSGTGIGLSFSQGVVETHGGRLSLEPVVQGATFAIHLPGHIPGARHN